MEKHWKLKEKSLGKTMEIIENRWNSVKASSSEKIRSRVGAGRGQHEEKQWKSAKIVREALKTKGEAIRKPTGIT